MSPCWEDKKGTRTEKGNVRQIQKAKDRMRNRAGYCLSLLLRTLTHLKVQTAPPCKRLRLPGSGLYRYRHLHPGFLR